VHTITVYYILHGYTLHLLYLYLYLILTLTLARARTRLFMPAHSTLTCNLCNL
jgi:hypothetical protein